MREHPRRNMYALIFSRIELEKHIKAIEPFAERSHVYHSMELDTEI
jgi:hypothetical protein